MKRMRTPDGQEEKVFTLVTQVIKISACIPKDALGLIKDCKAARKVVGCYKKNGAHPENKFAEIVADPNMKTECGLFHQGLLTNA